MITYLKKGKKVRQMSMAQFDDINDICCEQLEEEQVMSEDNTSVESSVNSNAHHENRWWIEVVADTTKRKRPKKSTSYTIVDSVFMVVGNPHLQKWGFFFTCFKIEVIDPNYFL